jgi:hypothetical protein
LSEADIESLQILTEGFVNNCFKKKIKFFLSNLSENLVNIPIFRSILKTAIDAYLHTQSVQTSLSRGDTKSMLKFGQIPIGQYLTNPSVRICKDSISASLNSSLVLTNSLIIFVKQYSIPNNSLPKSWIFITPSNDGPIIFS